MTREEAIKIVRNIYQTDAEKKALETLIPELAESDGEMIRNWLIFVFDSRNEKFVEELDNYCGNVTREQILDYLEKQKDASKAIKAVERIDKYIDENVANAHDMKDSNPDKKYYRGWDDALSAMAGILQDVYSGEKQKDQPAEEDSSEKDLAECYLSKFDKKFPILPTLKGKQLADYKNFLNTCQQVFGLKEWGIHPTQAKLFAKLTLLWASWGAEHLQGIGAIDGDNEMDEEIKPAEWSEEEKTIIDCAVEVVEEAGLPSLAASIKSLRPQPKQERNDEDEEDNDFIIYHPLKNGKGEYECIPYSFYGSLTSFSEDKDLIDFLRTCFYTEEECNKWIEQQKEQEPVKSIFPPGLGEAHFNPISVVKQKPAEIQKESVDMNCITSPKELICSILKGVHNGYYEEEYADGFGKTAQKILELSKEELKRSAQKPVEWSEEDKEMLRVISNRLEKFDEWATEQGYPIDDPTMKQSPIAWFKDIPERFNIQSKQEWSEEDEAMLKEIISFFKDGSVKLQHDLDLYAGFLEKRLKSLRPQSKQEWSEEDEKTIGYACYYLNEYGNHIADVNVDKSNRVYKTADALKLLRPSWKPSYEQMKALEECGECKRCIKELYDDLVKNFFTTT